jgi:hypothetical protein
MTPQLIIAGVLFASGSVAGFGAAWKWQAYRMDAKELEHVQQQLANERSAATTAIRRTETVIAAQSAAAIRERGLRNDVAGARTAAISLHDAAAAAMRDASVSHAACTERAAALGDVLQASAERYRDLGETCDRHVSDIKTLIESWPKEY